MSLKRLIAVGTCAALGWAVLASAQGGESAAAASELRALLAGQKLQSVAAIDPSAPDRFIAVSYVENVGFLFVAARSTAVPFLRHAVETRQYQEAYTTLNGTAISQGKLFVQDAGADGLRCEPMKKGGAFDIVYQDVTRQLLLNGESKAQHLGEDEYLKRCRTVDESYTKDLSLLVEQLKTAQTVTLIR